MRHRTERIVIHVSDAERRMLEHLAMAERVSKAFIVRKLLRAAAQDLYSTIELAQAQRTHPMRASSTEENAGDSDEPAL